MRLYFLFLVNLTACIGSQIEMVTVLLEAGANCHELDGSGHTPIHLAKSRLHHLRGSLSEATRQEVFKVKYLVKSPVTSIPKTFFWKSMSI